MLRELSCGARSVCFLLPQYRGRYVSQMRNTHGISKALQYLKTHRARLASQDSGKSFSLAPLGVLSEGPAPAFGLGRHSVLLARDMMQE